MSNELCQLLHVTFRRAKDKLALNAGGLKGQTGIRFVLVLAAMSSVLLYIHIDGDVGTIGLKRSEGGKVTDLELRERLQHYLNEYAPDEYKGKHIKDFEANYQFEKNGKVEEFTPLPQLPEAERYIVHLEFKPQNGALGEKHTFVHFDEKSESDGKKREEPRSWPLRG